MNPNALENIWVALSDVHDPEFPMSLVDMGLVYGLSRENDRVRVKLTFTAMGCPAMEMILDDLRARLLQEPNVREVEIEIVWDPPWNASRMTENGRETLRAFGVAV
ncbi:MAG: metal-sulfur cluster assembly factor [Chloroflexi bacterium]|nr:metal-sulfur cluster assembly factor [Chloroflexota bacterium]